MTEEKKESIVVATLTGLTWDKVVEKLTETLPEEAYKKIPGGANLTDINPAYLREALTHCFGPYDIGWCLDYLPANLHVEDTGGSGMNKYFAYIKSIKLVIALIVDGEKTNIKIPSAGSSNNSVWDYAANGAITSALGKAASYLLWQQDVYKGLTTHATVAEVKREEKARRKVEVEQSKPDALMGDDAIKVLLQMAADAGYDLKVTRLRNALFKALSIPRSPLNKMTAKNGRIVYQYCKTQVGVAEDALEGVKDFGKAVAKVAVSENLSWDDAAAKVKKSIASDVGGKVA